MVFQSIKLILFSSITDLILNQMNVFLLSQHL